MLSIVICTYNRAYLLKEQMGYLKQQELPFGQEVEIIYVDNNSTDGTADILRAETVNFPVPVRVVCETKQGLSNARNRGWREAKGEYIIYLDDDSFPLPGWLRAYGTAFEAWQPEAAGGPILPLSKQPTPKWLDMEHPEFAGYVVNLNLGSETRYLERDEEVWGANMAFARTALEKVGGFNPNLGMNGKQRFGGEESEIQRRICSLGGQILFIHNAPVHHLLINEKRKLTYFLKHNYKRGASYIRYERLGSVVPMRECRWKTRSALSCLAKALMYVSTGRRDLFIKYLSQAATYSGAATEILKKRNPSI